jgi:hypothetical protein
MRRKSRSISLHFFSSLTLSLPPVNLTGARFCRSDFSCTASRSQPKYRSPPSVQDRQPTVQHVRPVTLPSPDKISSIAPPLRLHAQRRARPGSSDFSVHPAWNHLLHDLRSHLRHRYRAQTLHPPLLGRRIILARAKAANSFATILDLNMAPNDAWPSLQLPSAAASCNVMRYDSRLRLLRHAHRHNPSLRSALSASGRQRHARILARPRASDRGVRSLPDARRVSETVRVPGAGTSAAARRSFALQPAAAAIVRGKAYSVRHAIPVFRARSTIPRAAAPPAR